MLLLRFDPEQPLTLGAIFNITTGVIEDRYGSTYVKDNKENKVWFLHMGDMDSVNQKINFEELEENERRLNEKREARAAFKPTNNPLERNELRIHENKFLQTSDYLISCRGKTIGYSMKNHEHNENNQIIHKGSCILPTHHFLVLRPRSASLQDIEYLHFVLDMYVEHVLSVEKNNKNSINIKKQIYTNDKKRCSECGELIYKNKKYFIKSNVVCLNCKKKHLTKDKK
jgi:hypothetical protein